MRELYIEVTDEKFEKHYGKGCSPQEPTLTVAVYRNNEFVKTIERPYWTLPNGDLAVVNKGKLFRVRENWRELMGPAS